MSVPASPPLLAADTMLFIYHFENHPDFGPAAGRILGAAEGGRCRLVVSCLALMEVLVVPERHGEHELCRQYRDFFRSFPNLEMMPIDGELAEVASDLRASHRIRTPDALHLATALRAGARAFLTEDLGLGSTPEIEVWSFRRALEHLPGLESR